jgi:hypothetical protein
MTLPLSKSFVSDHSEQAQIAGEPLSLPTNPLSAAGDTNSQRLA